jgi:cyanophycinase
MQKKLWPLGFVAATLGLASAFQPGEAFGGASRGGHLVIIGGGERPAEVTQKFIELAGGREKARLVIIPLASEDFAGAGRSAVEEFKALGVSQAGVLPSNPDEGARNLRSANAVYFTGGDQVRLVSALAGTPIPQELHELWRRGGVIGGTSAGAAVMSARMITGEEHGAGPDEERFRSIQSGRVALTNGFGFLTNVVIDQHFIARKRENRLFSVILEMPGLLGIGIDESTAIVVKPDQHFEVIGDRSVMVIDARKARHLRKDANNRFAANDLVVHFLLAGDEFDLRKGLPIPLRAPPTRPLIR